MTTFSAPKLATTFLAYVDDAGRFADFHSLRHTFLSNLARSGVHPKLAQALARHSTITLTMDRYSHTVLGEQGEAVEALPSLAGATTQVQQATGTDGKPAAEAAKNRVALCVARKGSTEVISVQSVATNEPSASEQPAHDETPEITDKTALFRGEIERGAGGSRTHGGGFAIRCLSHLATAP